MDDMEDYSPSTRNILWCVPRSCSTALTMCLNGVDNMEIWFEPFCFCYLAAVKARNYLGISLPTHEYEGHEKLFGQAAEVLKKFNGFDHAADHLSYASVKQKLQDSSSRHVLVKDMAFAFSPEKYSLIPEGFRHSFVIRHPLRVFHSNRKGMLEYLTERKLYQGEPDEFDCVKDDPLMSPGLLFKDIFDIWNYVKETLDPNPLVIDADDLLSKPAEIVPKICRFLHLPFDKRLLNWEASSKTTDKWLSPLKRGKDLMSLCLSFYGTSMTSTGFGPSKDMPSYEQVTPDVVRSTEEVLRYYNEMYKTRLL